MLDQQAVVADYKNGALIGELAAKYSALLGITIRPADISAVLRLHNVPIRRGNPNIGIQAKAAAAARQVNALHNNLVKLVEKYGAQEVLAELQLITGGVNE
jgi:hypothetical protein